MIELTGEVSAAAEQRLLDGVRAGDGREPRRAARLRRRRLHQLDRDRADRRPPRPGAQDGQEVQARGLAEHYREIFRITRLSDFMTILDDDGRSET